MKMNRREFIKKSAGAATCAAVGMTLPGLYGRTAMAGRIPDIVVANGAPGPAARAAVDALGGMGQFVKSGSKVVIKPA